MLNPESSILDPESSILDPESSILDPESSILNPQSSIRKPHSSLLASSMPILVRRSNLLVPVTDAALVEQAWQHDADAITLDLEGGVAPERRAEARLQVRDLIAPAAQGGAEVFVRPNKGFLQADLEASVWPGLHGVILPQVETAAEVTEAAELLTALERRRGIALESLQCIVLLESARAVWDIRSIVRASRRVTQVGLDEVDLAGDLGIAQFSEEDPFVYARGRLIIEAIAAKVNPIGMAYPRSVDPGAAPAPEIHALATKARNLGTKGVLCPHASWVAPVNEAFTPAAELVAWNKRVRLAFAAGVAAGTAAVPLEGRMIDVPVDEWAAVVLATAEACAARDAEKQAARSRAPQS
jgi:citrate lyase subunit beta/citryl-CoA lyase